MTNKAEQKSRRKQPLQARSQLMVETIIDSAARVLIGEGYGGFTTNRVAEVAGVSVGSLYQYFPNKQALIEELSRKHIEQMHAAVIGVLQDVSDSSLDSIARQIVQIFVAIHQIDTELHKVLSSEVPKDNGFDWQRELASDLESRLMDALYQHSDTRGIVDKKSVIFVLITCVENVVHSSVIDPPTSLDMNRIEDTLSGLIVDVLTRAAR